MRRDSAEDMFQAGCIHEAAHAVVAYYFGAAVREVQIQVKTGLSGPRPDGSTWVVPGEVDPEIEEGVVLMFAGPEAEAWWWAGHHDISIQQARRRYRRHASMDLRMIGEDLSRLGEGRGFGRQLEREAMAIVPEVWGSIVSVAEALRDCNGYLTGDQVLAAA